MKVIFSETSNLASKMEGKDKYIDFDRKFIEPELYLETYRDFLQSFSLDFCRIVQFLLLIIESYFHHGNTFFLQ